MTATCTTGTPPRFIAWQRVPPSRTWERVAEADTGDEALLLVLNRRFPGTKRDVLVTRGTDPNLER